MCKFIFFQAYHLRLYSSYFHLKSVYHKSVKLINLVICIYQYNGLKGIRLFLQKNNRPLEEIINRSKVNKFLKQAIALFAHFCATLRQPVCTQADKPPTPP
jgi:hypothetical protein